jgi:hypothetical protein
VATRGKIQIMNLVQVQKLHVRKLNEENKSKKSVFWRLPFPSHSKFTGVFNIIRCFTGGN